MRSQRLVVSVLGRNPRRSREVLRWLRLLLPTAILLLGPAPPPAGDTDEVITVDTDAVQSGPLSVADAVLREHRLH